MKEMHYRCATSPKLAVLLGIEPSSFLINSQAHTPCLLEHNKTGCRGWIRTNDFMAYETRRMTTSILCDNLAPQDGIEPPTFWLTARRNYRCATEEYSYTNSCSKSTDSE